MFRLLIVLKGNEHRALKKARLTWMMELIPWEGNYFSPSSILPGGNYDLCHPCHGTSLYHSNKSTLIFQSVNWQKETTERAPLHTCDFFPQIPEKRWEFPCGPFSHRHIPLTCYTQRSHWLAEQLHWFAGPKGWGSRKFSTGSTRMGTTPSESSPVNKSQKMRTGKN